MNVRELFYGPMPQALCAIFQLGILPKEDDFIELTSEQLLTYQEMYGNAKEKIYRIMSFDPSNSINGDKNTICLTEYEKDCFIDAIKLIKEYCKDCNLSTDEQKLRYAASKLPEVFSRGTNYAR